MCAQCGAELGSAGRGRPARFCGNACRCAAYRRRQRGLGEDFTRQAGPRGRRRLESMVATDNGLQAAQATAREVQGLLSQVLRSLRRR
jgi:diaminopimelate epimerase